MYRLPVRSAEAIWLAKVVGVTPGPVSQIERGKVATIDAIARYIEALGGGLTWSLASAAAPSPWSPPKQHDGFAYR
jgi:transcriptional regulator with XRE-family HTH domain